MINENEGSKKVSMRKNERRNFFDKTGANKCSGSNAEGLTLFLHLYGNIVYLSSV